VNNIYLVAYDITNNKLRRKIEKLLCDYGVRLQYSVFRCVPRSGDISELRMKLCEVISKNRERLLKSDSVVIIGGLGNDDFDFLAGIPCNAKNFMVL